MAWRLVYRCRLSSLPIEVDGIVPDVLACLSRGEVEQQTVLHGNRLVPLAEFFDVSVSPEKDLLIFEGDLHHVHWIGAGLQRGRVRVEGSAGRHVGSEMRGGSIDVRGDAGDWAGAEMHGGHLHIQGNSGNRLGAAYHGSVRGMTGGSITVRGNTGDEAGHSMRRGLIAVSGNAGHLVGFNMIAGTILVLGDVGMRPGAGMRRGTLACLGKKRPELLSSFVEGCHLRSLAIQLLMKPLHAFGIKLDGGESELLQLHHGDLLRGGRGEILTRVFV